MESHWHSQSGTNVWRDGAQNVRHFGARDTHGFASSAMPIPPTSSQVANAKIVYGGQGVLADVNTKGWIARVFDSNWWPF